MAAKDIIVLPSRQLGWVVTELANTQNALRLSTEENPRAICTAAILLCLKYDDRHEVTRDEAWEELAAERDQEKLGELREIFDKTFDGLKERYERT